MSSCFETEACICAGDNDGLTIERLGWVWERGKLGPWEARHCCSFGRAASGAGGCIMFDFWCSR